MSYDLFVDWKKPQSKVLTKDIVDFYAGCGLEISVHPDFALEIDLTERSGMFPIVLSCRSKLLGGRFKKDLQAGFEIYSFDHDEPDDPAYGISGISINLLYEIKAGNPPSFEIFNCVECLCGFVFAGAIANILDGIITDPQSASVRIIPSEYEQFSRDNLPKFLDIAFSYFKSAADALSADKIKQIEEL